MNKKDLEDAISEGVSKGFWGTLITIIITIQIIFIIIMLIGVGIEKYQDYKWQKENCPEGECVISKTVLIEQNLQNCDKPYVHCGFFLINEGKISQTHFNSIDFCGWEEVNAYLEYYKENGKYNYPEYVNVACE